MIEITTATGGCGYVYVSWSVIGDVVDDLMCGIGSFNITLSSMDISMTVITRSLSYDFTGLPDDTVFNVIVIGISVIGNSFISFDFASLKTLVIESMFVYAYCIYVYVHAYIHIHCACKLCTYLYTHMHTCIHNYFVLHMYIVWQTKTTPLQKSGVAKQNVD